MAPRYEYQSKPNPVGIKSFVRCGKSSKAYDFELYQGAGTGISAEHTYLGLDGSTVMQLVKNIPRNENFKVFFDNYFTSIVLLLELKALGMYSLGVVKSNRMAGTISKPKSSMQKEGRGSMGSRVTKSGEVVVVRWYDNSSVIVASRFVGIGTTDVVDRWSTKEKTFVPVNRPEAIEVYNDFMGRVDKMDFLISLYPMVFRTKRWPTRVILHLVSMSLVDAWIENKERQAVQGSRKKNIMDLLSFREHVVEALCKAETNRKRPVGRPSFQSLLNYCLVPNK